jgi:1-deoxy-D-xylulose-5-phosphate reductoisomerase
MMSLAVMGSTGSIGCRTLDIVDRFPSLFNVKAITAKSNLDCLINQIVRYRPEMVAVCDRETAQRLKARIPSGISPTIMCGRDGYCAAAAWGGVDTVVMAMVGAAGLEPTLSAIQAGKGVALATKETLVMAGAIVMEAVSAHNVRLMPIDSEHSAIFQCLQGQRREDLERIILTASGGPFRQKPFAEFDAITPAEALKHPNWHMGAKITIDSATMMNKGLEVIEAKWLFGLTDDQIEVLIHPQSIVHSMVAFRDGSIIAQMGIPDMLTAIAYALSYPQRLPLEQPLPDFGDSGALTFEKPDLRRFPCLQLAFDAIRSGGSMPAVLNAANEVAVAAFLAGRLNFKGINQVVYDTMSEHRPDYSTELPAILAADKWARSKAEEKIASQNW